MNTGWIKIHRKFSGWEWKKKPEMVALFIHLLLSANHKEKSWQGVKILRGQLVTGRKQLSADTGISEQSIRTCLKSLKSTSELTIKSTSKYSIITICNYDDYQRRDEDTNQQLTSKLTSSQPATNQQLTTNKNGNNIKNVKKRGTLDQIKEHCKKLELPESDAEYLYMHWTENNWANNGKPIKDWRMVMSKWKQAGYLPKNKDHAATKGKSIPKSPKGWLKVLNAKYQTDYAGNWETLYDSQPGIADEIIEILNK